MSYPSEVLALSPVVYWRLGESAGTNANDETANNNDGTYSNVVLGQTGLLVSDANTSVKFDDNNDAKCENSGGTNLPTGASAAWSLAFWHKTRSQVNLAHYFGFGNQPSTGSGTHYYFWGQGSDWDTGVNFHADSAVHFIVFTGSTAKAVNLYVDGSLAAGPHTVASLGTANTFIAAGSHLPSGNAPNCDLQDCAVFASELTPTQIANLYTVGTSPPPPPTTIPVMVHQLQQQGIS